MNVENKDLINKQIDEGECSRIKVLISALRDTETKPLVKKDIIAYLLDSYELLTRSDAQLVIEKADEIFSASTTPKNVIIKICVLLKKFREKTKHVNQGGNQEKPQESSAGDSIIEVEAPEC